MSNPIHYLVALLLVFSYPTGIEPLVFARSPNIPLAACGGAILLVAFLSAILYTRMVSPNTFRLARTGLKFLNMVLFGGMIFLFHFPLFVWRNLGLESIPGLAQAVMLLPFLAMMGAHAIFQARAESRIRADGSTWKGHLLFGGRTFLGFSLFPLILLLFLQFLFGGIPAIQKLSILHPSAAWGLALGVIILFLLLAPFYLKFAFSAPPLPAGSKRARLEELARNAGFRYRDLLLIDTRDSRIANALIIGLLPRLRYVFFTSTLFQRMDEGELECVMAHEMSHGLRKHLTSYFLFTMGYLALATGLQDLLAGLGIPGAAMSILFLVLFFACWVTLFGYVSRRFETEADLVGASLLKWDEDEPERPPSRTARLAQALHRVCALNGVHPGVGSWRHFSVSRRSLILLESEENPAIGKAWERTCTRIRNAGLVALGVGILYATHFTIRSIQRIPQARVEWEIYESASRGWELLQEGRAREAAPLLERSLQASNAPGEIHLLLSEAYRQMGREGEAKKRRKMAERAGVTDPRFRLLLEPTSPDR